MRFFRYKLAKINDIIIFIIICSRTPKTQFSFR